MSASQPPVPTVVRRAFSSLPGIGAISGPLPGSAIRVSAARTAARPISSHGSRTVDRLMPRWPVTAPQPQVARRAVGRVAQVTRGGDHARDGRGRDLARLAMTVEHDRHRGSRHAQLVGDHGRGDTQAVHADSLDVSRETQGDWRGARIYFTNLIRRGDYPGFVNGVLVHRA